MTPIARAVDLASPKLGGRVIAANDEFFAAKENLIRTAPPIFLPDEYTDRGKWMDGWETRRRRTPGHDWCVVRLGAPGKVEQCIVDTAHFRGNHPEACAIDGCEVDADAEALADGAPWRELLARVALNGDSQNPFDVSSDARITHLRLRIFPDGGVARLRVLGRVLPDWDRALDSGDPVDLAAVQLGGRIADCSDMFFGHSGNMLMPGRPTSMQDGWETRRRRGPGHDWAIVEFARQGEICAVEIDTTHFKGNAPGSCSLEARVAGAWTPLLADSPVQADAVNRFARELMPVPATDAVRLNIVPDGGVARLRVYCRCH